MVKKMTKWQLYDLGTLKYCLSLVSISELTKKLYNSHTNPKNSLKALLIIQISPFFAKQTVCSNYIILCESSWKKSLQFQYIRLHASKQLEFIQLFFVVYNSVYNRQENWYWCQCVSKLISGWPLEGLKSLMILF